MTRDDERDMRFPQPPPPCEQVARAVGVEEESRAGFSAAVSDCVESAGVARASLEHADAAASNEGGPRDARRVSRTSRAVLVAATCAAVVGIGVALAAAGGAYVRAGSADADRAVDAQESRSLARSVGGAQEEDAVVVEEAVSAQLAALASDEDGVLTAYVQQFLDGYDAGIDAAVSYGFADIGITADDLTDKLREGLSFSVDRVDVYGDRAWIDVSVSSKSFSDQADAFAAARMEEGAYADDESYRAALKEALLSSFDKVKPRETDMLVVVDEGEEGWLLSSDDISSLLGSAWYGA